MEHVSERNALYKETLKIVREKATIKAADIPDAMKAKMLSGCDARVREIASALEALDRHAQGETGAVQAPQTAAKRS